MKMKYFLTCALIVGSYIEGNPSGEKVVHGQCQFERADHLLTVYQSSPKAIIHWNDFSIQKGQITRFLQPSSGAVLNRVISNSPTEIFGQLQSNGKVFLLNQNGILIGKSGLIKTGGFIASTLDVLDSEFLGEGPLKFLGNSSAKLTHEGTIETLEDGTIFIAREIDSSGLISAPYAGLGGGTEIFLAQEGNHQCLVRVKGEGSISHNGTIEAAKAELKAAGGNIFSIAVNHSGIIEAAGSVEKNGQIFLVSGEGTTQVTGHLRGSQITVLGETVILEEAAFLDASHPAGGGQILVGGDFQGLNLEIPNAKKVYIGKEVQIQADALETGDGGKVILWGDDMNHFYGSISARGGSSGGDGGFVEISSKGSLIPQGKVTTLAPQGNIGTLLLDPTDVIIGVGDTNISTFPPPSYGFSGSPATIDATVLGGYLDGSNVLIDANTGAGGTGTVSINSPVTWGMMASSGTTLTINAPRTITINSTVTNNHTGSGSFVAMHFETSSNAANYQGIVFAGGSLVTTEGDVELIGRGGSLGNGPNGIASTIGGSITSLGSGKITLTGSTLSSGNDNCSGINLTAMNISSAGGKITLNGTGLGGMIGSTNDSGILLQGSTTIIGTNAAQIEITGISGRNGAVPAGDGVGITGAGTKVSVEDGTLSINGTLTAPSNNNSAIAIVMGAEVSSSGLGDITIDGQTANPVNSTIGAVRIESAGTTISSTSNGNISITGKSFGTLSGGHGVDIDAGSIVSSSGIGTILIHGEGSPTGPTGFNIGTFIDGTVTSMDGKITIEGLGGAQTTLAGNGNSGVQVTGLISSIGTAEIEITGTGGPGVNTNYGIVVSQPGTTISSLDGAISLTGIGDGSGIRNHGIAIQGQAVVTSMGMAPIDIHGTASMTGTTDNYGIEIISTNSKIESANATITLTGFGGGTMANGHGLKMDNGLISSTMTASIIVNGTGGGTQGDGIRVDTSSKISADASGPITLTGIPAGTGLGINLTAASSTIGKNTASGLITLNAETMNFTPGILTGIGSLLIQPINPGTSIGLGTGEAGTLNLDNTDLSEIVPGFTLVMFGQTAGTHLITTGNATFTNPTELRGSTIAVDNPVSMGANALTFTAESMSFTSTINGTSTFLIQPHASTTTLGIGTGEPGSLTLDNTSIGNIGATFSSVLFGRANGNGLLTVGGNATFLSPSVFRHKNITVASPFMAGAQPITFNVGLISEGTFNLNSLVTTAGLIQAVGGAFDDLFNINIAGQTMTINGGGGNNTLFDSNSIWNLTGPDSGDINGMITFSNIQNLLGGNNVDSFVIFNPGSLSGGIDGGGGINTLDYSNYTAMPVVVDFATATATAVNSFANIQDLIGNMPTTSFTLIGPNTTNTWHLTTNDTGDINGTITFADFGHLNGGASNDTFMFNDGIVISGLLNGAGGSNALDLSAYTTPNMWTITGNNSGNVNSAINFINIQNLIGGSSNDTFIFGDQFEITGSIDGSGGANTLDYTAFTTPAGVCFLTPTSGTATNIGNEFLNISSAIGNFINDCPSFAFGQGGFLTQLTLSYPLSNYDRDDMFTRLQKWLNHYVDPSSTHTYWDEVHQNPSIPQLVKK